MVVSWELQQISTEEWVGHTSMAVKKEIEVLKNLSIRGGTQASLVYKVQNKSVFSWD